MSDDQRLERIKEALLALADLGAAERREWLGRHLAADPRLRAEIESLLDAGTSAGDAFLEPVVLRPSTGRPSVSLPERVGPYLVEGLLGQGAMGRVYRARQHEPVDRRVAVKVVDPLVATPELVSRFRAEQRATAGLEHPNIARLLDAGVDDAGSAYVAMELVDGPTVTEYCRTAALPLRGVVALAIQVARGLHHAHVRGVLHRDIKPSNVLVATTDAGPVAKLIDFGVARILTDADAPRVTTAGQLVGTVEYMSPEQLDPVRPDADVRSDVYALGVLAYEMLTGLLPRDPAAYRHDGAAGAHRLARGAPPPRPSARAAQPGGSRLDIPADLDCVVLKALEPDRDQRWPTAKDLADDLQRVLEGRPVLARPPSTLYRATQFVRRHRLPVAAAALVLLSLVGGLVATSLALGRATHERARAERSLADAQRARADADAARADAEEVTRFLRRIWSQARPAQGGPNVLLREAAVREARAILATPPARPLVRARVALAIGEPIVEYNELDVSQSLADLALAAVADDPSPAATLERFNALMLSARVRLARREPVRAGEIITQATALADERLTPTEQFRARILSADVPMMANNQPEALRIREDALARAEGKGVPDFLIDAARGAVVRSYFALGRYEQTLRAAEPFLDPRRAAPGGRDPAAVAVATDAVNALLRLKRLDEARPLAERNAADSERVFGPESSAAFRARSLVSTIRAHQGDRTAPDDFAAEFDRARRAGVSEAQIASWHPSLAEMYVVTGREADAAAVAQTVLSWFREGKFEPAQRSGFALAVAELYTVRGRPALARPILDEVCPKVRELLPGSPLDIACKSLRAKVDAASAPEDPAPPKPE